MLTPEQIQFFHNEGYVVVRNRLSVAELNSVSMQVSMISSAYPELLVTEKSKVDEGKNIPFQLRGFIHKSSVLNALLHSERLGSELEQLMGEPCTLLADSFKFKHPGGGDFYAHQDMQGPIVKHVNTTQQKITRLITFCVALDEHNENNGCLEVAAGQHKNSWMGASGENLDSAIAGILKYTLLTLQPGDAVYFDGFLPHRSGINRSDRSRRALFLFCNAVSEGEHYPSTLSFLGLQ